MFFDKTDKGVLIRVRINPNSSSCCFNGIFVSAEGVEFLKINVISVPEKGKANRELIAFLSKRMKIAKSCFNIISGDTDRYKKIIIEGDDEYVFNSLKSLIEEA